MQEQISQKGRIHKARWKGTRRKESHRVKQRARVKSEKTQQFKGR